MNFPRPVAPLLFASTLLSCTLPAMAEDNACHMQNYGTLDLISILSMHTAGGEINGTSATFTIDTGASMSVLMPGSAEKFDLTKGHMDRTMSGVSGVSKMYYSQLKSMSVGDFKGGRRTMALLDSTAFPPGFDGLIGADILLQRELEIHMADNKVRFFRALNCEDQNLAYWDRSAPSVGMDKAGPYDAREVIIVELNGKPFRALLDSGAHRTTVTSDVAAQLGVTPDTKATHKVAGIGGATDVVSAPARFDSIAIGNERIEHPTLLVTDLYKAVERDTNGRASSRYRPDIILGNDFFMKHRLMLSESQRKLYYSYSGGEVFGSTAVTLGGNQIAPVTASP